MKKLLSPDALVAAFDRLDVLAEKHPELVQRGPPDEVNQRRWMNLLRDLEREDQRTDAGEDDED